ncbi:helix-turn-helix domain-containing protein [Oricola sp.]|uniref:helix-turn-helix domain-containing protein n=1 Tax=Oricola sp. TaxID=1979950 RepID=UPI00351137EB
MTASTIRALQRGVSVLQAVNKLNGAKPADIADATGIPRASIYRLLETLEEMRMVHRDHFTNKWRPTANVRSLSSGFREEDWVCQNAVPHILELGRQVLWPVDLVTFRNNRMEVRESTHQISPYSVHSGIVGQEMPVMETASGRAMLAFMPEEERGALLALLSEVTGRLPPFLMRDGELAVILDRVRELGVGFRKIDFTPETGSISAPIWHNQRILACVTVVWSTKALQLERAIELYRDKLFETAEAISRELSKSTEPQKVTSLLCARRDDLGTVRLADRVENNVTMAHERLYSEQKN